MWPRRAQFDPAGRYTRKITAVSRTQMDQWLNERGVTLIGADLDESPMSYRRLPEVLAQHAGAIKGCIRCGRSPW
jgi:hypothetical protein